ncbi:MAG: HNH endonuclease [Treponema sp.]|nr:HNH endonuclease [Treponema sp.]
MGKTVIKSGDVFNKLTVIEKTQKRTKCGAVIFKCKCICGKETFVASTSLKNGHTKSCGCLFIDENKKKIKRIHELKLRKVEFIPNEIIVGNEYAIIKIKKHNDFISSKIDLDDVEKINKMKWSLSNNYICNVKNRILLHRFIMNISDSKLWVDHINHDTFDNRKCNLRIVTPSENAMNKKLLNSNKSGKTGVYLNKKNKFIAQLGIDYKTINLGTFNTMMEAVKARKIGEEIYFKEHKYKGDIKCISEY